MINTTSARLFEVKILSIRGTQGFFSVKSVEYHVWTIFLKAEA